MHAATFAPHLLNHLRAIEMFAFKCDLSNIYAASVHCTHSVAPALRHTHGTALMQQIPEDVMRKKPKDPRDRVMMRVSIEI